MSKLSYLIFILAFSFLLPQQAYSSAVPASKQIYQEHSIAKFKKKKKKKHHSKRMKKAIKTEQTIHFLGVIIILVPALVFLGGIVLLIVGLSITMPVLWITGLIILGTFVLAALILLLYLIFSINGSSFE